jgi:chaperonin GroEL
MKNKFSLYDELSKNLLIIEKIYNCIKITLGPTGKNAIIKNLKDDPKILTNGSLIIKSINFNSFSGNILLKLLEQASVKTSSLSGDGSSTTILFSCNVLEIALFYLINGYSSIFLSNGLKKTAFFLSEKILDFSKPISNSLELIGILKTSLGKKINFDLINLLYKSVPQIGRDGLILVEENRLPENEIELVQGIELDKGFASSYFVNDLKNFEVSYDNPYILIASDPIYSINQIRELIDYIKSINRPLIIIGEDINKEIISTLVLNNIQKKLKVAVIRYTSIKFLKTGILEDLAILTHSKQFFNAIISKKKSSKTESTVENTDEKDSSNFQKIKRIFTKDDLGQADRVIIKKEKSTFLISKFSKLIAKRRINELNRELLTSETDYEKSLFKTRIARLSGNIAKIKVGTSNKYQIEEERQKVEKAIISLRSALEEGVLPGGGSFYLFLRQELKNWSYLNLIGDEQFASHILTASLVRPFEELCKNTNHLSYKLIQKLSLLGYPYGYNLVEKEIVNTLKEGLLDSAKSIRGILWNSLSIISTLITSE